MYPVIFFDALRVKMRDEGTVRNKAVYLALGVLRDGTREILYGLGNFSFDQMYDDEVRQGLIPRHRIYNGKLLQTELLTTMLEKYAQPRWATAAERDTILSAVFGASKFPVQ